MLLIRCTGLHRKGPRLLPDSMGLYEHQIKNTLGTDKEELPKAYKWITRRSGRSCGRWQTLTLARQNGYSIVWIIREQWRMVSSSLFGTKGSHYSARVDHFGQSFSRGPRCALPLQNVDTVLAIRKETDSGALGNDFLLEQVCQ